MTGRRAAAVLAPPGRRADPQDPTAAAPEGRHAMPVTSACSVGLAVATVAAVAGVVVVRAASGAGTTSVPTSVPTAAGVAVAVVGILLGIPHGAVDHVVAVRLARPAAHGPGATMAVVLASYLLVAAVAAGALLAVPDVSVAVFLVVAAAHFAWGEITFAAERRGRRLTGPGGAVLAATALGLVLVGLPLATVQGRAALAPLAPGLAAALDGRIALLPGPAVTIPPGGATLPAVLLAVITAAGLALAAAAGRRRLHREAAEVLTLLVLFLATPPLIAFGVYFGAWHALRHTRRLVDLLAPGDDRRIQALAFARAAAAPTAGATGVLILLWTLRADADVVVTGVSLLLALTFPHVLVVAALDRGRARRTVGPPDARPGEGLPGLG
jgi:Brp/Blh family beta-carotene 15,15'-monooxygenase